MHWWVKHDAHWNVLTADYLIVVAKLGRGYIVRNDRSKQW